MTVWDATRLVLIDSQLPIEDPNSSCGRVWQECVLDYTLSRSGILDVQWGRYEDASSIVYLLRTWTTDTDQQAYHEQSLATSMLDFYLAEPSQVLYPSEQYPTPEALFQAHNIATPLQRATSSANASALSTGPPSYFAQLLSCNHHDLGNSALRNSYDTPRLRQSSPEPSWRPPGYSWARECFQDGLAVSPPSHIKNFGDLQSLSDPHAKSYETIEMRLRGTPQLPDRRAFEFYIMHFWQTEGNETCILPVDDTMEEIVGFPEEVDYPINVEAGHWVDHSTYRLRIAFSNLQARLQWVRDFVAGSYEMLGARVHAIACMANVVSSETETGDTSDPASLGGDIDDKELTDEDMGF